MRITLVGPQSVTLGRDRRFVAGEVYDLPEQEARNLLARKDPLGRVLFKVSTVPAPKPSDKPDAKRQAMELLDQLAAMGPEAMDRLRQLLTVANGAAPEAKAEPAPEAKAEPAPEAKAKPKTKSRSTRAKKTLADMG